MKNSQLYKLFSCIWWLASALLAIFAIMFDKASATMVIFQLLMMLAAGVFQVSSIIEAKSEKEQEKLKKEQEEKFIKWLKDNPNVLLMLTQIINKAWDNSTKNR